MCFRQVGGGQILCVLPLPSHVLCIAPPIPCSACCPSHPVLCVLPPSCAQFGCRPAVTAGTEEELHRALQDGRRGSELSEVGKSVVHTPHLTPHISHLTPHISHLTSHTSHPVQSCSHPAHKHTHLAHCTQAHHSHTAHKHITHTLHTSRCTAHTSTRIAHRAKVNSHARTTHTCRHLVHIRSCDCHMTQPPCRLLKGSDAHVLQRMVNVLEHLGRDPEMNNDIRVAGGIPLLLHLLQ